MTFRQYPILFMLIAINIALFLAQQAGWDWRGAGALWLPLSPYYQHWQWLTHQFLHDNLLHILVNMYALGLFGAPLLRLWGTRRFLLLYFSSGFSAAALYSAWQLFLLYEIAPQVAYSPTAVEHAKQILYTPMLGASGAIFGVLAAFSIRLPHTKLGLLFIPLQLPARIFVGVIIAYELFAQFSGISLFGDNIAHLAHVGGAIAGGLLGWLFTRKEQHILQRIL